MKISIITPSFNQVEFIQQTLDSVLYQNYLNYEHIVVDGGSTDGALEILRNRKNIKLIAERDNGQAEAINKGINKMTGEIFAWLNTDDFYEKDTLKIVSNVFNSNADTKIIYGNIRYVDQNGIELSMDSGNKLNYKNVLDNPYIMRQPAMFIHRSVIESIGLLNEKYHLAMDLDFYLRVLKKYEPIYCDELVVNFRVHNNAKTTIYRKLQFKEIVEILIVNRRISIKTLKFLIGRFLEINNNTLISKMLNVFRKK